MTEFVLSAWDQQPALMSLHEFLREGSEVSYRFINRLSHLIQNLDISGSPHPFSPGSRKNSWREWDGKRVCLCECFCGSAHSCATFWRLWNLMLVCVHMCIYWPEFSRASCPEPHTVFPVGFPRSPLGRCCVFYNSLCLCECVTAQLKRPPRFAKYSSLQLRWYFSAALTDSSANAENCSSSSSPADGLVQRSGKCWLKLLSFQVGVLSARLLPLWDLGLCYCKEKGRYQVTVTQREESMVRKARRRASQWDSGMPMVPLKSRESGDVQMVLFVSWVFFCQASLCIA